MSIGDDEVVRRVIGGESSLFELLMRRHNQRGFRMVRSILRDDADAEDALQQAWLQAFAHLGSFHGTASFSTWFLRIAVNEARMRLRRAGRVVAADELTLDASGESEVAVPNPTPEEVTVRRELAALLEAAIDELPDGYRSVIVLRDVEGMSTAETAEVLEVSDEVVKTRLHRARAALRDRLYDQVGAGAGDAFAFRGHRCDRIVAAVMSAIRTSCTG